MGRKFVIGSVLVFFVFRLYFFLISMQNQVPKTIIGVGRVIYQIMVILVVIRSTLQNSIVISQCREKSVGNF